MSRDAVGQIFGELEARFRLIVREVVAEELEPTAGTRTAAAPTDLLDAETRRQIAEQTLLSNKSYLTRAETAVYLGVSERSIKEWSARAPDHNPFPEVRAGADPRYRRTAVDEWLEREGQRQRLKLVS